MPDLSFDEVRVLAKASSLEVSEEDLVEVTHRLNVIISGIENFSHPDLDKVDPVPFRPLDEVDS
ncbi:uncharacterized protein METZ01_LOCUS333605 [marine metagenome]|uniref:Aspartyl/glutamyl-tRNA(Asn/Gln) amidotransferase subunit C n=1 Tax=marine metagenome TaxID=408172 RepID=A0A382Q927_9ZZZZ